MSSQNAYEAVDMCRLIFGQTLSDINISLLITTIIFIRGEMCV